MNQDAGSATTASPASRVRLPDPRLAGDHVNTAGATAGLGEPVTEGSEFGVPAKSAARYARYPSSGWQNDTHADGL